MIPGLAGAGLGTSSCLFALRVEVEVRAEYMPRLCAHKGRACVREGLASSS